MPANVEIIRKEMIKPSSPTPHHLKEHKLSFLDQLALSVYIPCIFFYEANQKYSSQLLKTSLSIALTHYYPLAGRISTEDNKYYIHCNDTGALFVEAKVQLDADLNLHQFIENPNMDELKQLLHLDPIVNNNGEGVILAVQINMFGCGGTAIGVQMSHKVGDGNSLVNFMNAWGSICRGDVQIIKPSFEAASLFPPIELSMMSKFKQNLGFTKEKIVTKHLFFDKEKLEILKAEVKDHCCPTPTRVEIISAIIWKQLMKVTKPKFGTKTLLALVHAVNLRTRMHPSLPDCAFGNIVTFTAALPMNEGANGYKGLVSNLRVAIKSVDGDFVKKIQNMDEYTENFVLFEQSISKGEIEPFYMSSWCRFPVYEVDYGWGKPVWVSTATVPIKNIAVLLTTKDGDGIEVWFNLC